jgi:hypothetical protein
MGNKYSFQLGSGGKAVCVRRDTAARAPRAHPIAFAIASRACVRFVSCRGTVRVCFELGVPFLLYV